MPKVYVKREDAVKHTVKEGKTLGDIADEYKAKPDHSDVVTDWKTLSLYNWGTDNPKETNRALFETIGVSQNDDDDPSKTKLKPDPLLTFKPYPDLNMVLKSQVLIPKTWKQKNVPVRQKNKVEARQLTPRPPVAISIDKLDKWFIPDKEECEIGYTLEGLQECADKVELEVYGSHYCECTDWNKGLGKYNELPDEPVYKHAKEGQTPPAAPRNAAPHTINWKGKANPDKGILSIKTEGKDRFINVAFSPYTVLLRYYKNDADKNARIVLHSFWPKFDATGKVDPQSLDVKWEIKGATEDRPLENGTLLIWDKEGKVVFRKGIPPHLLKTGGPHTTRWGTKASPGPYTDGQKNSKGEAKLCPEDMPYRVQIQAHTGPNREEGLAIAAAHTEVRVYVHPQTHLITDKEYDPAANEAAVGTTPAKAHGDPQTLEIALGPIYAGATPDEAKGRLWYQYKLAEAGYHPGPVDGKDRDDYKMAMREFQRSVPKQKTGTNYERLSVTGTEDNDTKNAINNSMADMYRRPWFGDPTKLAPADLDQCNLPHKDDAGKTAINNLLKDKTKELIVWVDARHYYTTTDNNTPGVTDNRPLITIGDYHGAMGLGDRVINDYDSKTITRPWIPLKVDVPIMGKADKLDTVKDLSTVDEDTRKAMRKAIGPIRVNWSFDEIGADLSQVNPAGKGCQATRVRTREYVEWALNKYKKSYKRKDTGRTAEYTNCPKDFDGIRPSSLETYFREAFGHGDDLSLQPWRAEPDSSNESIATVVHDHLIASQAKDKEDQPIYEDWIGHACVYFHPSRIAGDGYRVRAQVQFKKIGGYNFPNLLELEKRYTKLSQAVTAKLRIWRKSSIRGCLQWSVNSHWGTFKQDMIDYYHAAHVHLVDEGRQADVQQYRPTGLIDNNPKETAYKTLISNRVPNAYHQNHARMKLDDSYSFPWYDEDDLGSRMAPGPVNALGGGMIEFANLNGMINTLLNSTWETFQEALTLHMGTLVEGKDGRLRGHLILEYTDTRPGYAVAYACPAPAPPPPAPPPAVVGCGNQFYHIQKNSNAIAGVACPVCGTAANKIAQIFLEDDGAGGGRTNAIVGYAIGNPGGTTWMPDRPDWFHSWLWAHELGHNRHLEHAAHAPVGGASDQARRDRLHDSVANPNIPSGAPPGGEPEALHRRWDRCCIMSYVHHSRIFNVATDSAYFCGKCILRNRGWKVETITGGP